MRTVFHGQLKGLSFHICDGRGHDELLILAGCMMIGGRRSHGTAGTRLRPRLPAPFYNRTHAGRGPRTRVEAVAKGGF